MDVHPCCLEYSIASPKTNLPSASVLSTSTCFPFIIVIISPGRIAPPPGIFSAEATTPKTFIGRFNFLIAIIAPITAAAPAISPFIAPIFNGGFKEIPPVSKVIPFPQSEIFCVELGLPRCSITINLGSSWLPADTPNIPPIPNCWICDLSRIVQSNPIELENPLVLSASSLGGKILPGSFPKSLAIIVESAKISPSLIPSMIG